jgi:hypothetical protein
MIEMQYITNEVTRERRLYFRFASHVLNVHGDLRVNMDTYSNPQWGPWTRVPELTLEESSMQDLIESGGIVGAP